MPHFHPDTPREDVKIQGIDLTMPLIYTGDNIAAMPAEDRNRLAKFANERLLSIHINSFGGDIRRALAKIDAKRKADVKAGKVEGPFEEATPDNLDWDFQALLDAKFAGYKIGESNAREAKVVDQADKIAWGIASNEVKNRLTQKGLKIKPIMDEKNEEHGTEFNRLVYDRLNHPAHHDRIFALARAQVESQKAADGDDDDLDVPAELQQPNAAARKAASEEDEAEAA